MPIEIDKLKAIATVLKKRFPNLTVEETIDLSGQIMVAIEVKAQPFRTHDLTIGSVPSFVGCLQEAETKEHP